MVSEYSKGMKIRLNILEHVKSEMLFQITTNGAQAMILKD